MKIVTFSLGLLGFAFLVHWCLWRIHVPKRQIVSLLAVFFAILPAALFAACFMPVLEPYALVGFWEICHVSLCYLAVALAYTVAYSAIEQDSPTLSILAYVAAAGEQGRSREDLLRLVDDETVVGSRFDGMIAGGLIVGTNVSYTLGPKGRRWAMLFYTFRRLYRLDKGG